MHACTQLFFGKKLIMQSNRTDPVGTIPPHATDKPSNRTYPVQLVSVNEPFANHILCRSKYHKCVKFTMKNQCGNAETDYFWRGSSSFGTHKWNENKGWACMRSNLSTSYYQPWCIIYFFSPYATLINSSVLKASLIVCFCTNQCHLPRVE